MFHVPKEKVNDCTAKFQIKIDFSKSHFLRLRESFFDVSVVKLSRIEPKRQYFTDTS